MIALHEENTLMIRLLLDEGANIDAADEVTPAFDYI
jgi:ankyrin repeat protein